MSVQVSVYCSPQQSSRSNILTYHAVLHAAHARLQRSSGKHRHIGLLQKRLMPSAPPGIAEDRQQQADELSALEAIYGDDCVILPDGSGCQIYIPDRQHTPNVCLRVFFPSDYPSRIPPLSEVTGPHLSDDTKASAVSELDSQFCPGEVVLFTWVEWLKQQEHLWAPAAEAEPVTLPPVDSDAELAAALQQADLSDDRAIASASDGTRFMDEQLIIHGEPFTEHRSTFQAHLAPVTSQEDVEACMATLLQHNKIRNATHNILAYRIYVKNRDAWLQDYDDDGEDAAGGRLLHLLQILDIKNLVVIVTRWYGGIHLGPARFTHINNAARTLLDCCGYIENTTQPGDSKKKKGKKS